MNSVLGTKDCYGCGVCAASCKRNAIHMNLNSSGFYEPVVDEEKCVHCNMCDIVCSFRTENVEQDSSFEVKFYAGWSRNNEVRKVCSSGGVGFEIARFLLSKNYCAILCRYNLQEKRVEHYLAKTEDELKASIGSKYIQSDTSRGFAQLRKDSKYLVVGTPCQIDSMRRWVKKLQMDDDVFLVDFFCHGVPSMLMWEKYLSEVEKENEGIKHVSWRDKKTGWHDSWVMNIGDHYTSRFSQGDLFYRMYLKNRCLSKPCYEKCKFKVLKSAADIRIGDLWGSKYADNEEGVNGVVALTKVGSVLLKEMESDLHLEPSTEMIVCESQMKRSARRPVSYGYVMRSIHSGKTLRNIDKVATLIEQVENVPRSFKYYASRLPVKMKELLQGIAEKMKS